jgi:hypothetical protein
MYLTFQVILGLMADWDDENSHRCGSVMSRISRIVRVDGLLEYEREMFRNIVGCTPRKLGESGYRGGAWRRSVRLVEVE